MNDVAKAMQAARILREYCKVRDCSDCFLEDTCGVTDPHGWEWPEIGEGEEANE